MKADGSTFGGFEHSFECQREVTGGCSAWLERGAAYVAASLVSFGNALKVAHER